MPGTNATTTSGGKKYLNGILTANAILLGVLALNGMGLSFTSVSHAETDPPRTNDADEGGRVSAAEQRKTIIAQLTTLTQKVERLDVILARGVPVRVLEMPAGFANKGDAKADDKSTTKSESKAEVKARTSDGSGGKK